MIQKSLKENSEVVYSNFLQLATVDKNNQPQVRTLSFKGIYNNEQIKIITELKSHKVIEINNNDSCQICWYFPISREQYRISCKAKLVTATNQELELLEERKKTWEELSDERKNSYYTNLSNIDKNDNKSYVDNTKISDNFVLLLLTPLGGDYYLDKEPYTDFEF